MKAYERNESLLPVGNIIINSFFSASYSLALTFGMPKWDIQLFVYEKSEIISMKWCGNKIVAACLKYQKSNCPKICENSI